MPRALASRKLWLAVACFSALMLVAFIPGCGTVEQRTAPVTDLSFNPDRNELYIGARSNSNVRGSGGFAIYEIKKDHFIRMNETKGFTNPNVASVGYDSASGSVFISHNGRSGSGLLSIYDPSKGTIDQCPVNCKIAAISQSRLFFSNGNQVFMANRTQNVISTERAEIYPDGLGVNSSVVSAMLWADNSLYFNWGDPRMIVRWEDGATTNITGVSCKGLAPGPQSKIFFWTYDGLGYYDSASGQVINTSCSGDVIDVVANARDNMVYAVQNNPRSIIVAYHVDGNMTSVLLDIGNCPPLSWGPTCIEFSATRNELFIGTYKGLIIYNIATRKYRTKTDKDGMPLIPSYYQGPGFEAVATIAVIVAVVYIRKKRQINR